MTARNTLKSMLVLAVALTAATSARADNWPRFGGIKGDFHSAEKNVPTRWDADGIAFRVEVEGLGQSSPVIWGDKLFLTSAAEDGSQRHVWCLSPHTGKTIWRQSVPTNSKEPLHRMNSYATPSCATDGERVLAFFGAAGLHCFDMDGKKLWSKDLGDFPFQWGVAASPVIFGDMVVQNCDAIGPSRMVALDKKTGKLLWETKRQDKPKGGWSTPIMIDTGKRKELVINGEFGVKGYDPATGKELWFCKSFNGRGTPVPAWAHGLVITINGKPGDIYAVKPGGSGNVTDQMVWHTARRGGRDLPSPIVVGDFLFTVAMGGVASAYHAPSGRDLWRERLDGEYSGSPVSAGGLVYITNEAGQTYVIKPGPALDVVSKNTLGDRGDEIFRATPAINGGRLYIRSDRALYCVGPRAAE